MHELGESIDAVYTWVDGQSPEFSRVLERALGSECAPPDRLGVVRGRFRDNGELRYSLRSLELYAPWIRYIHILTNGQTPRWLDTKNPRIRIVTHDQVFLQPQSLPTFNSNAIELQLHRIPGLSRRFLYFNDDVFLGRYCARHDFALPSDGQRIYFEETELPNDPNRGRVHDRAYAYTIGLMPQKPVRRDVRRLPAHMPQLYDREILARLEIDYADAHAASSRHRFRTDRDVVLRILYIFHQLEVASDRQNHEAITLVSPSDDYTFLCVEDDTSALNGLETLGRNRPRFFCINDDLGDVDMGHVSLCAVRYLLQHMFPERSSFELRAPSSIAVYQRESWNQRLRHNWDFKGVGSLALGRGLNRWIYRARKTVFRGVVRKLDITAAEARILDIGSGTGYYLQQWLAMGARNITAVDISDVAVTRLKSEFPQVTVILADVCEPLHDLEGESFDVISVMDVLFHIIDDEEYQCALSGLSRLLNPDGRLIFTENFLRGQTLSHKRYWKSRTREAINQSLSRAGLETVSMRPFAVLMGSPVDTKTARPARIWDWIMRSAGGDRFGNSLGALIYPFERLLLGCVKYGPSTKIAVCRRKPSSNNIRSSIRRMNDSLGQENG